MKNIFFAICFFFLAHSLSCLLAAEEPLILWWSFDEHTRSTTKDQAANIEDSIEGNFKYFPGVSGLALKPDGFTTCIIRNAEMSAPDSSFTIEAWIAHAAYPWNWCPVISQRKDQSEGFSFNLGPRGNIALEIAIDGTWQKCVSEKNIVPLRQWKHVAATFNSQSGIYLYVDGKPAGHLNVKGKVNWAREAPLRSLMNEKKVKPSDIHREHGTLPGWYSFDGLIDEVKMYNSALSSNDIAASFKANFPGKSPDLPPRVMPSGPKEPGRFGAYYCNLKYYEEWDNLWAVASDPDIVVRFDNSGTRMVFWRGSRYSPAWVSANGLWMADQSVEAWGVGDKDKEGCFEHMQDRRCRYSHVRIIESHNARVVVHWRYAPVSSHDHLWREDPKTGRACWVDEYYYVYPDQMGIRNVSWKTGTLGRPRQFQESLPFTQPGQLQSDVINIDFAHVANLNGEIRMLSFCKEPDKNKKFPDNLTIQRYNFKSVNKPSIIFESGNKMEYVSDRRIGDRGLDVPGACNHWPVGQAACDGRTVRAADRPTHFLGFPISYPPVHEKDGRSWWNGLYGMTDLTMEELVFVANSWNNAPDLEIKSEGFESRGYDLGQRAYILNRKGNTAGDILKFCVAASENSPVFNPCFVVTNWDNESLSLTLNGQEITLGKDFRVVVSHTLEKSNVIIWVKIKSTTPISITLK